MRVFLAVALSAGLSIGVSPLSRQASVSAPRVELVRLPEGGIQPQAVMDEQQVLHVLYFKGPPAGGDLYYLRMRRGAAGFSRPLRVNSAPGTALATGSVRGGQLAVGANGRAHVAWYGARELDVAGEKRRPVWYARLGDDSSRFDPQVNVAAVSKGIDGATVAADRAGNVYVAWHGEGQQEGEAHRTVYVARSRDGGVRFAREEPAAQASTGACGCCGLRAMVDSTGKANILYRSATEGVHRDAAWIALSASGSTPVVLQPWKLNACPMSTFALGRDGRDLSAAWETEGQIYYARLNPAARTFSSPLAMEGPARRKHPSVATNEDGVTLVAWTEGTGWARGGTAAWQAIGRDGKRLAAQSNAGPVPVWGLVAAAAWSDGSFVILH
jgi:hypothetical protein